MRETLFHDTLQNHAVVAVVAYERNYVFEFVGIDQKRGFVGCPGGCLLPCARHFGVRQNAPEKIGLLPPEDP